MLNIAIQVGIVLISGILSRVASSKPAPIVVDEKSIYDQPPQHVVSQDAFIPIVFGTVLVSSPNVVWFTHRPFYDKHNNIKHYDMAMHSVFCAGPVSYFCELLLDGGRQEMKPGNENLLGVNVSTDPRYTYYRKGTFLDDDKKNETHCSYQILSGAWDQEAPQAFQDGIRDDEQGEAYRGVCSVVFADTVTKISNLRFTPALRRKSLYVPQPSAVINRVKDHVGLGYFNQAYATDIIIECLTDTDWGLGMDPDLIDLTSFSYAKSVLHSENFGLNFIISSQGNMDEFIKDVLRHIDGTMYVRRSTGKICIKLLRDDGVAPAATLDESIIRDVVKFVKPSLEGLPNHQIITHTDARYQGLNVDDITSATHDHVVDMDAKKWPSFWSFDKTSVFAHNIALKSYSGRTISAPTNDYPGVYSARLALNLAQRDLRKASTPAASIELECNWHPDLEEVYPGDLINLTWNEYLISEENYRVISINHGTLTDSTVVITAIQDVFSFDQSSMKPPGPIVFADAEPILTSLIFELPYWMRKLNNNQHRYDSVFLTDTQRADQLDAVVSVYSALRTSADAGSEPYPRTSDYRGVLLDAYDVDPSLQKRGLRQLTEIIRPSTAVLIPAYPANPEELQDTIKIQLMAGQITENNYLGIFALIGERTGGTPEYGKIELLKMIEYDETTRQATFYRAWLGTTPKEFDLGGGNTYLIHVANDDYSLPTGFDPIKPGLGAISAPLNNRSLETNQTTITHGNKTSTVVTRNGILVSRSARPDPPAGLIIETGPGWTSTGFRWKYRDHKQEPVPESAPHDSWVGDLQPLTYDIEIHGEKAGSGTLLRAINSYNSHNFSYEHIEETTDNQLGRLSSWIEFRIKSRVRGSSTKSSSYTTARTLDR